MVWPFFYSPDEGTAANGSNRHKSGVEMRRERRRPNPNPIGPGSKPVGLASEARRPPPVLSRSPLWRRVFSCPLGPSFVTFRSNSKIDWITHEFLSSPASEYTPGNNDFTGQGNIAVLVPGKYGLEMLLESSREFLIVAIRDSIVGTPNMASDMSVEIVSMKGVQWCALFCHL